MHSSAEQFKRSREGYLVFISRVAQQQQEQ